MRNIIQHRRLPLTFHSVSAAANAWHIVVCDAAGATLSLTVPAGRPLDVRNAIQDRLKPPSKTPPSARLPSPGFVRHRASVTSVDNGNTMGKLRIVNGSTPPASLPTAAARCTSSDTTRQTGRSPVRDGHVVLMKRGQLLRR